MFEPMYEGTDHINIYSKSSLKLGRALSNFAHSPFTHPELGEFESMEGLYYYLKTGQQFEELRNLYGWVAKKAGNELVTKLTKQLGETACIEPDEELLVECLYCKVKQNPTIKKMLKKSNLPFAHYYYYGKIDNCKVVNAPNGDWLIDGYTEIRFQLKNL